MGLTRLVDTYCVRQAIYELKKFPTISLSVNVSNHTLTDPDWLKEVTLELRDHVDVANRLIIEITESVAMSDLNQTLRVIRVLEDLGCRIALNDLPALGAKRRSHRSKNYHLILSKLTNLLFRK